MDTLNLITLLLIIVGGINWGLVALGFNLVDAIFGAGSTLARLVYALVGLAALYQLYVWIMMLSDGTPAAT